MNKNRSEFEKTKTYDLCKSWQVDFDEECQYYYSINPVFHADVTAINSAWRMFQEQQTNVDELKKQLEQIKSIATELAEYASYAEIVGGVSVNRVAVRSFCDKVFDFNRKVDEE